MKITYQTLSGRTGTKEFATIDEFLTLQNREIPALEDSVKITVLEIDGQKQDFTGNALDLYNKFNEKNA